MAASVVLLAMGHCPPWVLEILCIVQLLPA